MWHKTWGVAGIWIVLGILVYATIRTLTDEGPLLVKQTVQDDGALRLKQHPDGHFYVKGHINDRPVTFLVDTGASRTAISDQLADELGLRDCRPVKSRTANGTVFGCISRVESIAFGPYRLTRQDVHVLPRLEGPALLGMSVLAQFRMEQQGGALTLRHALDRP